MAKQKTTGSFDNLWDIDTSKIAGSTPKGKGEEQVRSGSANVDNVEDLDEEEEENEYTDEEYEREVRKRSARSDSDDEDEEDTEANKGGKKQPEDDEDESDEDDDQGSDDDEEDALPSDSAEFIQNAVQELINDETLIFDSEKEYDISVEGLRELINETKEVAAEQAVEDFRNSLGEEGAELMDYLSKGFSVDEYLEHKQQVDFSKVNIENERNQAFLVEDWLKVQGHTPEEIEDMLQTYRDTNILDKQAKIAQNKLVAWQKKNNEETIKAREQKLREQEEEEAEKAREFQNELLNADEIAGFKISKVQRQKLYDYITKPVNKEGKTQFQVDDNTETRMLYALLAMNKFDKSFLEKEIRTKQSIKLKRELSNYSDSAARNRNSGDPVKRGGQSTPKVNWAFGPGGD